MTAAGQVARWLAPEVPTPALVVDADILNRNIDAMARHAASQSIDLRPHAKTHKSPEIALAQLAAGAVGLAVATVGEAEVFADAGIGDLFVAYPVWAAGDVGTRLRALAEKMRLSVGVDSVDGLQRLRAAAGPTGISVVIEVDCGLRRTGIRPEEAGGLAVAATDAGFEVDGVFTFPGHGYAPGAAPGAITDEGRALAVAEAALEAAGLPCELRSGGSTPTAAATAGGVVTELRPGVYVFNDAQQVTLGTCAAEDVALAAMATVVSTAVPDRMVLDAGSKVLGPDRPPWMDGHGLVPGCPGATVTGLWEHHAVVDVSAVTPADRPAVGDRVAVVPNHVCTAVNLAEALYVVSGGEVVDRWEVAARGANR